MKDTDFLNKLREEKKLSLVEPAEEVAISYEKKSKDCLSSAKLLFKGDLFENSIGEAYYSIYNSIQSLFFKCGIKCENHSATAILLKKVFRLDKMYITFSKAKEERVDKQYYVTAMQVKPVTKESSQDLIISAEKFILEINSYKENLKLDEIKNIRKRFEENQL